MTKVPDLSGHGGLILDNATRGGWSRLKGQDVKRGFSRGPIMPNPGMEDIWPLTHKANSSPREPWGRNSVRTSRCVLCTPILLGYRSSVLGVIQHAAQSCMSPFWGCRSLGCPTTSSKHIIGSNERYLLGQKHITCHTTCRTITSLHSGDVAALGVMQLAEQSRVSILETPRL